LDSKVTAQAARPGQGRGRGACRAAPLRLRGRRSCLRRSPPTWRRRA